MMSKYNEQDLATKLIRPLNVGESFMVAFNLELNVSEEMYEYCGDWMHVFKTDRSGDYMFDSPSIEFDGKITSYRVTDDSGLWEWFPYHMNIFETNKRLLKTDQSLSAPIKYSKGLPSL